MIFKKVGKITLHDIVQTHGNNYICHKATYRSADVKLITVCLSAQEVKMTGLKKHTLCHI